eukprot:scaffold7149_cov127-Skeletonema_marinoi.AAC.1
MKSKPRTAVGSGQFVKGSIHIMNIYCDNLNLQQAICWMLVSRLGAFQKHIVTVLILVRLRYYLARASSGKRYNWAGRCAAARMTSMFG